MAVKLYCNVCKGYIKDISVNEGYQLTGNEVCEECKKRIDASLADIEALGKKAHKELDSILNQIETEKKKLYSLYEKYKKRVDSLFCSTELDLKELVKRVVEGEKKNELSDLQE